MQVEPLLGHHAGLGCLWVYFILQIVTPKRLLLAIECLRIQIQRDNPIFAAMKTSTRPIVVAALACLAFMASHAEAKRMAPAPPKHLTWKTPYPEISEPLAILKLENERAQSEKMLYSGRLRDAEVSRTKTVCKQTGKQGLATPRYVCSYTVTYR